MWCFVVFVQLLSGKELCRLSCFCMTEWHGRRVEEVTCSRVVHSMFYHTKLTWSTSSGNPFHKQLCYINVPAKCYNMWLCWFIVIRSMWPLPYCHRWQQKSALSVGGSLGAEIHSGNTSLLFCDQMLASGVV